MRTVWLEVMPLLSIWDFPLFPVRASTFAGETDAILAGLILVALGFIVVIFGGLIYFAVKYRAGSNADRVGPIVRTGKVEAIWIAVPFTILLSLFIWAGRLYFIERRPPSDAINIYVVGKQWMWKTQHPTGRREINELHIPAGRPVRLIMTSQDVIHSFFVPAFRLKRDVLPGQYTDLWFEATRVGEYHLFCAQYCGTNHSRMVGRVVVMAPRQYQEWLATGTREFVAMPAAGSEVFTRLGCNNCHVPDSNLRAPQLEGLFGRQVKLQGGQTVSANENYIRESILEPQAKIVAGYPPIMPSFKGQVSSEELQQLVEYIKSLGKRTESSAAPGSSPP